jgi:2,3-bisphosphoglycerate-independent phosphoglycerate mutase
MSMTTKYALILPEGLTDEPQPALGDQTPLEFADTPNLDWIGVHGRQGTAVTIPEGLPTDSAVAHLCVLGYDPKKFYPGRAALEIMARGVPLTTRDLVLCCNLVTVMDGRMIDDAAGRIGQSEAEALIKELNERIGIEQVVFHLGKSYRHWMVLRDAADCEAQCARPQDILHQPIRNHLPTGRGSETLRRVMEQSANLLTGHEINKVRQDLGENPATQVWLWGPGRLARLPRFESRHPLRAVMVGTAELMRGLAKGIGWEWIEASEATGGLDTNLAAKGRAAAAALEEYDLVAVHVAAAEDAACQGNLDAKLSAISQTDEQIIGPLLEELRKREHFRIMVTPAYSTPMSASARPDVVAPFCMAGREVVSVLRRPFSEENADTSDLHVEHGHELMEYFLKC